jgi:hypothetical protein
LRHEKAIVVAKMLGVNRTTVRDIAIGKTWRDVVHAAILASAAP